MGITIVQGDIVDQDVDAVVNVANSGLMGGGGVDGAILRAGGPAQLAGRRALVERIGGLPTGEAAASAAGNMRASWVIHVVGPVYSAGDDRSELLAACYRNALAVADELGARSVAFPAVSAGIYGWPMASAADIAVRTVAATRRPSATSVSCCSRVTPWRSSSEREASSTADRRAWSWPARGVGPLPATPSHRMPPGGRRLEASSTDRHPSPATNRESAGRRQIRADETLAAAATCRVVYVAAIVTAVSVVPDVEDVFRAHYGRLVRALTLASGDREVAADAVQEAFVKAHVRWRKVSRMDDPVGWIRRVAINSMRDQHRRRGRKQKAVDAARWARGRSSRDTRRAG